MALQLILGGSGAGKTTYLYDEVIRLSMEHPQEQLLSDRAGAVYPSDPERHCDKTSKPRHHEH